MYYDTFTSNTLLMTKLYLKCIVCLFLISCASKKVKFEDYIFKTQKEKNSYIASYNKSLSLWNVPYTEENIKTTFGIAHVIISGPKNGKKLVLLHGMDASSTMWQPNIEALARNHRVYAIDFLMEPGKSTLTSKSLSKEEIIIWYNEIFDHYKLKNFDIVAASRGGWIATLLAVQQNNAINKIVLLSPAQTFEFIDQVGKSTSALLLKLFPTKNKLKKTLDAFSAHPEKINPVFKKQFYLANKYAKSNSDLLQMLPFSDEDLKKIKNPVLLLIGDADIINSEKSVERAQEFLVNSKTKIIKDAGHFLSIDQSKEVNNAIVTFLK